MIRRGDIVVVALSGDYGKPRPAIVVQSDYFQDLPSVTLCALTSSVRSEKEIVRPTIHTSPENGLQRASQIMVDKITTVPLDKIGQIIGRAEDELMVRVSRALAIFLGIA